MDPQAKYVNFRWCNTNQVFCLSRWLPLLQDFSSLLQLLICLKDRNMIIF